MLDPKNVNDRAFTYYARLGKVKNYVEHHIAEDLSLRTVARVAGLEEKYFSTFFRAKTGVTFKRWVSYVRIRRATEIMASHNETVANVAFAVGFQDMRTFERTFKRHMSMTPSAFKKSVRPC